MVTKPQMKSFAPGTLDKADANTERTVFGVSSSLWKGSSGGPCILLDGPKAGAIIGIGKTFFSFTNLKLAWSDLADPYFYI